MSPFFVSLELLYLLYVQQKKMCSEFLFHIFTIKNKTVLNKSVSVPPLFLTSHKYRMNSDEHDPDCTS